MCLGVTILKFGSTLETTVTNLSALQSSAGLDGLDLRIVSITILVSLIFMARAFVESMFALDLINERLKNFFVIVVIIMLSEVLTSFALVRLMQKALADDEEATDGAAEPPSATEATTDDEGGPVMLSE